MMELSAVLEEIEAQREKYVSVLENQHPKLTNEELRTVLGKLAATDDIARKFKALG